MTSKKNSKKENKLIIKNSSPSLAGIAEKSVKEGETVSVITAGMYLSDSDPDDPFVQVCRSHILSIMSDIIFPKLLQHFSHELPEKFHLQSVRVELFTDEKQNTIYFNKEAKVITKCKIIKGKSFTKNELVKEKDLEKVLNVYCNEKDPNAASLLFTFFRGQWIGIFDYHYNRKHASDKYQLAQTHLKSALSDYKKSDLIPFFTSLWDGYELLSESVLLLHNQLKLKESHKKISKLLHGFCEIRDLDYDKDFQDIRKIRDFVRYGPPHTTDINYEKKALIYLQKTMNFSKFVEDFLKKRLVNVNSIPVHTVDWFV